MDLVAEASADERAHRVVGVGRPRQQRFDRGAQRAADAEQPAAGEGDDVAGHAEQQAVRQPPQRAVPDRCVSRHRRGERRSETDALRQRRRLWHPREEGIGAFVDGGSPGERRRAQLAADAVAALAQLDDVGTGRRGEPFGDGETGDAAADDDDPAGHVAVAAAMTRRARAAITPGSSFTTAVRRKISPRPSARWRASMSRS